MLDGPGGAGALAAPDPGPAAPSEFIDLAEETGAVAGIGAWVLDTAFDQLRQWQRRHGWPGCGWP